jgi:hypothetical protein
MFLNPFSAELTEGEGWFPSEWLRELKGLGLHPTFFFTNKDQAQYYSAQSVWSGVKVQLCLWHLKRAVTPRLHWKDSSVGINLEIDSNIRNEIPFIDPEWIKAEGNGMFCPSHAKYLVIQIMSRHYHYHPRIPTEDIS